MIPGLLRVKFGTNEILVSLMLVYVAEQLLASMALGALRNPEGMGFPGSPQPGAISQLPPAGSSESAGMHWGVVAAFDRGDLCLYHPVAAYLWVSGAACRAKPPCGALCRGEPRPLILICMGISGALAGLAGLFEVAGPAGQISIDFNVGYGFTAIIVAFLGRLHPVGILLAGGLMALTYIGGEIAQSNLGPAGGRDPDFAGDAAVLPAGGGCADELPDALGEAVGMNFDDTVNGIARPVIGFFLGLAMGYTVELAGSTGWWIALGSSAFIACLSLASSSCLIARCAASLTALDGEQG